MREIKAWVVSGAASLFCTLLLLSTAYARAAELAPQPFDIGPQALASALKEFAHQSQQEILFSPEVVAQKHSDGVHGTMQPLTALRILLKDTDLPVSTTPNGAILVGAVGGRSNATAEDHEGAGQESDKEGKKNSSEAFRVAEVDQASIGPRVEQNIGQEKKKTPELEEVVVTGSRIPIKDQGSQDVKIYSRERIELSGQSSVSDFLNTVPSVSISTTSNWFQSPAGQGTVNLRGLPFGSTLVLINGRRVEVSGAAQSGDFFDLNNIPLAAVERIEVIGNGSSAVYGSDAIAGVVNIILKEDFSGFAASARYGAANSTGEIDASLSLGHQWGSGGASVIANYQNQTGLDTSDRALTSSNDYTAFGGPDNNFPVCNPGNVFSLDGTPLPGAPSGSNATYAAVSGTSVEGKPTLGSFRYGTLNQCSILTRTSIIPAAHRAGIFAEGHYDVLPSVELFTEIMYSYGRQSINEGAQQFFGEQGFQTYTASASNPYNPFGTTVGIAELLPTVPTLLVYDTSFFRPLVGARGSFLSGWSWEVSAWESRDWTKLSERNTIVNSGAIQNALNSTDPATALNPFVLGPPASNALLGTMFAAGLINYSSRDLSTSGFLRGPLLQIPSGAINVVVGSEYTRSRLYSNLVNDGVDPPNTQATYERHSYAFFAEARVPIVAGHSPNSTAETLALTVAGRHDHYSDFGAKNTPQVGLEWRPSTALLFRATYSEAFKAPPLPNLYSPDVSNPNGVVTDPTTGRNVGVTLVTGGNPNLRPITGKSHTFGFVYSSESIPNLRLAVSQWSVDESQAIEPASAQFIVDNGSAFPDRVLRDPAGTITEVIATQINFGSISISGFDYQIDYSVHTRFGEWSPSLIATQTYHYTEALTPGGPELNGLAQAQDSSDWAPRWKGAVALAWKNGPYRAYVAGRYVSRYEDYDTTRAIGNVWLCDTNLRYGVGEAQAPTSPYLQGAFIEVGAVNLLNRLPQFSNYGGGFVGYDPAQADIRGRFLYARIGTKF